jgi:putative membrane protein
MEYYYNYHFIGMHFYWWIVWIILLGWIFIIPYNIPGQRAKKETPLDILKKRLARGEISDKEYEEKKKLIDSI